MSGSRASCFSGLVALPFDSLIIIKLFEHSVFSLLYPLTCSTALHPTAPYTILTVCSVTIIDYTNNCSLSLSLSFFLAWRITVLTWAKTNKVQKCCVWSELVLGYYNTILFHHYFPSHLHSFPIIIFDNTHALIHFEVLLMSCFTDNNT